MRPKVKYLAVLASLLGLAGFVLVYTQPSPTSAQAANVVVQDGNVEWASPLGEEVTFVEADADAAFFLRDDDLEVWQSGRAQFVSVPAGTRYINLATRVAGASASATSTVTVRFYSGGEAYEGTGTPLVTDPSATTVSGNSPLSIHEGGGITLSSATNRQVNLIVDFQFHMQDTHDRTAKVTSTSDLEGEWVTITEVTGVGDSSPSANSTVFMGTVHLTGDRYGAGVYVRTCDAVTVAYYDSEDLTVLNADTVTAGSASDDCPESQPDVVPTPTLKEQMRVVLQNQKVILESLARIERELK